MIKVDMGGADPEIRVIVTAKSGSTPINYEGIVRVTNKNTGQTVHERSISGQITGSLPRSSEHRFGIALPPGSYRVDAVATLCNVAGSVEVRDFADFVIAGLSGSASLSVSVNSDYSLSIGVNLAIDSGNPPFTYSGVVTVVERNTRTVFFNQYFSDTLQSTGSKTYSFKTGALPDGEYEVKVEVDVQDAGGQIKRLTDVKTVTISRPAPPPPSNEPPDGSVSISLSVQRQSPYTLKATIVFSVTRGTPPITIDASQYPDRAVILVDDNGFPVMYQTFSRSLNVAPPFDYTVTTSFGNLDPSKRYKAIVIAEIRNAYGSKRVSASSNIV